MKFIPGLSALLAGNSSVNTVLLDLWGCVHDGTALYAGAKECMQALHAQNIKVLLLSNAPRRAAKAKVVLDALGVTPDLYDGLLTSGEEGYALLADGKWHADKTRYFFIGPQRDADVLDGLRYQAVDALEDAQFILNVGFGSEAQEAGAWTETLTRARAKNLPMLCLNPDMEVVKLTGERFPCAGVIAKEYEQMGAEVEYVGKPYPAVYTRALAMLGTTPEHVLAVGDGLHTDVQGANHAGISSVLVTGGILKQEVPDLREESVRAYCTAQNIQPDYVLSGLEW
jgi:HAD superfamily hydrolase (TIGR01459 family)